jgi:hypothetical protein
MEFVTRQLSDLLESLNHAYPELVYVLQQKRKNGKGDFNKCSGVFQLYEDAETALEAMGDVKQYFEIREAIISVASCKAQPPIQTMIYYASTHPSRPATPEGIPDDAEPFDSIDSARARAKELRGYVIDATGAIVDEYIQPAPDGYHDFMRQ